MTKSIVFVECSKISRDIARCSTSRSMTCHYNHCIWDAIIRGFSMIAWTYIVKALAISSHYRELNPQHCGPKLIREKHIYSVNLFIRGKKTWIISSIRNTKMLVVVFHVVPLFSHCSKASFDIQREKLCGEKETQVHTEKIYNWW